MVVLFFILQFVFTDHTPPLNKRIIQFVDSNKGRQVGGGECWDLAAKAFEYAGAYLDRSSAGSLNVFGKPVDPWKDVIKGEYIVYRPIAKKRAVSR